MQTERKFKKVINKIGITMILFFVFINVLVFVQSKISLCLEKTLPYDISYIISELLYGLAYFLSFVIPGIILYFMMGKNEKNYSLLTPVIPSPINTAAYIFASISIILTMAIINANIVSVFNYSEYSSKYLWDNAPRSAYQVVLAFITSALIPAFAEEFLFRGAIFSALMPYGKTPAIIISALLFGLMHQNIEQLLYTTAAGLVLAFVVCETGSIWCGVLIHFFNNFTDILKSELIERFPLNVSYPLYIAIEGAMFILGLASIVYLILTRAKRGSKNTDLKEKEPIPAKAISKHFFSSPTIIFFIVISSIMMTIHIILSILTSVL